MYSNDLNREDIDLIKDIVNYCGSTLIPNGNMCGQEIFTFDNLNREGIDLIKDMINYSSSTLIPNGDMCEQGTPTFNDYLKKEGKGSKNCWDLGSLYVRFVKTVRGNKSGAYL